MKSEAQRPPDGAVTATTFKTPTEATRIGSVATTERANTLPSNENPKPAELLAAPEEIVCDKLHGSATEANGFDHKREGWVPESDTASQAYFDNGSPAQHWHRCYFYVYIFNFRRWRTACEREPHSRNTDTRLCVRSRA